MASEEEVARVRASAVALMVAAKVLAAMGSEAVPKGARFEAMKTKAQQVVAAVSMAGLWQKMAPAVEGYL